MPRVQMAIITISQEWKESKKSKASGWEATKEFNIKFYCCSNHFIIKIGLIRELNKEFY